MFYCTYTISATHISFDGIPFSVQEKWIIDCQQGKEYFKLKKALNKQVHLQSYGSRKMACKAHITLCQYILYLDYTIPNNLAFKSKYQERFTRQQQFNQLKVDL